MCEGVNEFNGVSCQDDLRARGGVDEQIREVFENVGMQGDLRFFEANQRWRIRMQQDGGQTEKANGPVREPGGRNRPAQALFAEVDLDRSAVDLDSQIFKPRVYCLQEFDERFALPLELKLIKYQAQVGSVFEQKVVGKVSLLRSSRWGAEPAVPLAIKAHAAIRIAQERQFRRSVRVAKSG